MQKLTALVLFALAAISIGVLVSGASYSEWVFPGGLPLGNALAAIGLCSLAGSAYNLSPVGSVRRRITQAVLVVAVLWLPISLALAGNLELNFYGSRGTAWLVISSATAIAVLGSFTLAIAGALLGQSSAANLLHGTDSWARIRSRIGPAAEELDRSAAGKNAEGQDLQ